MNIILLKCKRCLILLFICLFIISSAGNAQNLTVSGTVQSAIDNQPLEGATILVKGTLNGTKSNVNGAFSINAEPNSKLIISFVGFESTEVKIGNQPPFSAQGYLDLHRDYLTQFNPNLPYGYYFQPDQLPADVTIDQWRNMSANPASQRCG